VQHAGRALALDPASHEAAELVTKLIVEPPEKLPPELEDNLDRIDRASTRARVNRATISYSAPFALCLLFPFLEVKSWAWALAFYGALAITGAVTLKMGRTGRSNLAVLMIANVVVTVLLTRIAGPLVLTPILVCGLMIAFSSHPRIVNRSGLLIGYGVGVAFLPIALELLHILPLTTQMTDAGLLSTSGIFEVNRWAYLTTVIADLAFVFVVGLYVVHVGRIVRRTQRQLHVQAWHLHQLLPTTART
jgi:hypothetical protein